MRKPKHIVVKPASVTEIRESLGISEEDIQIARDIVKELNIRRRPDKSKCERKLDK